MNHNRAARRAHLKQFPNKEQDELEEHLSRGLSLGLLRRDDERVEVALADLRAGALAEAVARRLEEARSGELAARRELLWRDGALHGPLPEKGPGA